MIVLVFENDIVGTAENTDNLPNGFVAYEVPDRPLYEYYFNGTEVVEKPPRPTNDHVWYPYPTNAWVAPEAPPQPPASVEFLGTPLFDQARLAAYTDEAARVEVFIGLFATLMNRQDILDTVVTNLENILTTP